ncbi:hypothetical protein O6P37_01715 [Mycobacterium sp. CPCC 205372]|uniref:Secreted protein n=1 Tax=Mycobacterium hippophais TaxID=3016340 RepID=A0ABT4PLY5_9MYCO|nr:hypothetical protein [Mycobacterium hippophais]MCZ8377572.1 hypothetical protein [Mycobacterium hippophais]
MLAIALAVVITVLVMQPASEEGGDGGADPTARNSDSEFASANDTGPADIITDDLTCAAWSRIGNEYADRLETISWSDRDREVSADIWSPAQKSQYEAAGEAMSAAAEAATKLAKQTPHRVMRELYEQFIAYSGSFVDNIPSYRPEHNRAIVVSDAFGLALNNVCASIQYAAAPQVAPLVDSPQAPSTATSSMDGEDFMFLKQRIPVCTDWAAAINSISDDTAAWQRIDAEISASDWTAEQRAVIDAVGPVMSENADSLEAMGRSSDNPLFEDFAITAAQYRRGYVKALPTYSPRDSFLAQTATYLVKAVNSACDAA